MTVNEYILKFTHLSHYALDMVVDMKSKICLFMCGLSLLSRKEGKASMFIGEMNIKRLMIHVQQVEKDRQKDMEEFPNKRATTIANEYEQQMTGMTPTCAKCGRNHPRACRDGSKFCFKCGQTCHFMREYPNNMHGNDNGGNKAQSFSEALADRAAPRGAISRIGGRENHMYAITTRQKQ
ncbi:uncharacterized protein LOC125852550 [Solanum stenotomum]|uniref:uncharacterized protein LOC125852550 n=1 Tax=Solanum stenotomum TaxID=172797 RepID=UPI0020D1B98E|nr:uncharacterized protein LOC125852550 [Solanum stenotomum]